MKNLRELMTKGMCCGTCANARFNVIDFDSINCIMFADNPDVMELLLIDHTIVTEQEFYAWERTSKVKSEQICPFYEKKEG